MTGAAKKIKILIAVPSLECGGLERNVSNLCNYINTDKFDVVLLVINNANPFYNISNAAIKIIDLQQKQIRNSIFLLQKIAKQEKPDIIISTANHLNLLFAIFRWMFGKKVKIIARESSIVSINTKRAKQHNLYNRLLKIFYKKLDLIVCQSQYMKEDLLKHYNVDEEKTFIIYNAVEVPSINLSAEKNANDNAQFITVARLSEEKGIDRIIRALAHVKKQFTYTIIGEGAMRKSLEEMITHSALPSEIKMPGARNEPFSIVSNPDLFLMGSHYEGFPNVLLEANVLGIPVVAYDAPGGISEVITNMENGILVEDGNVLAFAAAVDKAIDYPFDRKMISRNTIEKYNPQKIILEWESLFASILSR